MRGDNVIPWSEYAKEEWERMGISLNDAHTAADPLTVEDVSWQIAAAASDHGGAPAMLGLVMLSIAFAAGVLVGVLVPR
jgi:hypothetical protein